MTFLGAAVLATVVASQDATVTTLPLRGISSEATVASCGDRIAVRTADGRLLSIAPDATVTSIRGAMRALTVFRGHDQRCLTLDATSGLLDVSRRVATPVRGLAGALPDNVVAAAQSADGAVWFGFAGTNQIGVFGADGVARYYDLPDAACGAGLLRPAELRLPPMTSSNPIQTAQTQLLSASSRYVWGFRSTTPPSDPSYVIRIDPAARSYRCTPLETWRGAGLAALDDEHAAVLLENDDLLIVSPGRIVDRWALPGPDRYHAPPWSHNLVAAADDGAEIVSLKDGALWHYSANSETITFRTRFPGRPSWITVLADRIAAINTDASELMTVRP